MFNRKLFTIIVSLISLSVFAREYKFNHSQLKDFQKLTKVGQHIEFCERTLFDLNMNISYTWMILNDIKMSDRKYHFSKRGEIIQNASSIKGKVNQRLAYYSLSIVNLKLAQLSSCTVEIKDLILRKKIGVGIIDTNIARMIYDIRMGLIKKAPQKIYDVLKIASFMGGFMKKPLRPSTIDKLSDAEIKDLKDDLIKLKKYLVKLKKGFKVLNSNYRKKYRKFIKKHRI